jgi:hypothetical protein
MVMGCQKERHERRIKKRQAGISKQSQVVAVKLRTHDEIYGTKKPKKLTVGGSVWDECADMHSVYGWFSYHVAGMRDERRN